MPDKSTLITKQSPVEGSVPLYFLMRVDSYILPSIGSRWIRNGEGAASIEDIIAQMPVENFTVETLKKQIAADMGMGMGTDYPELGIVALQGAHEFLKPFAEYVINESGQVKYIKHPQFSFMVRRYK